MYTGGRGRLLMQGGHLASHEPKMIGVQKASCSGGMHCRGNTMCLNNVFMALDQRALFMVHACVHYQLCLFCFLCAQLAASVFSAA